MNCNGLESLQLAVGELRQPFQQVFTGFNFAWNKRSHFVVSREAAVALLLDEGDCGRRAKQTFKKRKRSREERPWRFRGIYRGTVIILQSVDL